MYEVEYKLSDYTQSEGLYSKFRSICTVDSKYKNIFRGHHIKNISVQNIFDDDVITMSHNLNDEAIKATKIL